MILAEQVLPKLNKDYAEGVIDYAARQMGGFGVAPTGVNTTENTELKQVLQQGWCSAPNPRISKVAAANQIRPLHCN